MLDHGSFEAWHFGEEGPVGSRDSGTSERDAVVLAGRASVGGTPLAIVATRFERHGGTIGVAEGGQLRAAFTRSTSEGLPMLAVLSSGGARLDEGTMAFVQLAKIAEALLRLRSRGLPYLVYLTNPTFGGALVALGALGHVTFAAPAARIGFVGPKVYEAVGGRPLPAGVQGAERLAAAGLVDEVVSPAELRERVSRLLAVVADRRRREPCRLGTEADPALPGDMPGSSTKRRQPAAWNAVLETRRSARPGAREFLAQAATAVTELHGNGTAEGDDRSVLLAIGRVGSEPAVVIGHDRSARCRQTVAGVRKMRRGFALAAELGLAVVTVIDTPGPELDESAELDGFVFELGRCLADLVALETPTLSVLLGEGAGGTALALLPADRVLCAESAWLAPLAPEGSSVVLYSTPKRAGQVAAAQRIDAPALLGSGIVDEVVTEGDGCDESFVVRMALETTCALASLAAMPEVRRRLRRSERLEALGRTMSDDPCRGFPSAAGTAVPRRRAAL